MFFDSTFQCATSFSDIATRHYMRTVFCTQGKLNVSENDHSVVLMEMLQTAKVFVRYKMLILVIIAFILGIITSLCLQFEPTQFVMVSKYRTYKAIFLNKLCSQLYKSLTCYNKQSYSYV